MPERSRGFHAAWCCAPDSGAGADVPPLASDAAAHALGTLGVPAERRDKVLEVMRHPFTPAELSLRRRYVEFSRAFAQHPDAPGLAGRMDLSFERPTRAARLMLEHTAATPGDRELARSILAAMEALHRRVPGLVIPERARVYHEDLRRLLGAGRERGAGASALGPGRARRHGVVPGAPRRGER